MAPIRSLSVAQRLLVALLFLVLILVLLWLALPRLLGMAAERWLAIPGVEALQVDIDEIGARRARLRELRVTYHRAGGERIQIAMHDVALDYSLATQHLQRLAMASAELEILPGTTAPQASPWPEVSWPQLPWSEVEIGDLRLKLQRPQAQPLKVHGSFRLWQSEGQLQAEFQADGDLLRMKAIAGDESELHADWLPATGPAASAQLRVGRQPAQQPAKLVAKLPLPVLAELGRSLGLAMPLSAVQGTVALRVEALLGDETGSLRSFSGEAEIDEANAQFVSELPLTVALAGKLRFAWQPSGVQLELQPGLNWQATVGGEQPLQVSSRLDRAYALRVEDGVAVSDADLPLTLVSPQWGEWAATVQRVRLDAGADLADWRAAEIQARIKGRLPRWQSSAIQISDLQMAGDVALRWSRSGAASADLAAQVGIAALSVSSDSALSLAPSTWQLKAAAAARTDGDFLPSLVLQGEASSPQLTVKQRSGQTLTLGASRVQLLRFRALAEEGGSRGRNTKSAKAAPGAEAELLLAVDAIRFGGWPSPDLRARLRLDRNVLRADGTLLLQRKEVVSFVGSHALARSCGETTLSAKQSLPALEKLLQPRPAAIRPLALAAGEIDARFTLNWCTQSKRPFDARGTLQTHAADLRWEEAGVQGVHSRLQVDGLNPLRGRLQLAAKRGELAIGTPLADLKVDVALAADALTVHALHLSLLGGSIGSEANKPISVPWPPAGQTLPVEVRQIDLGQTLAMLKLHGLSGSGQLDGVLPLTYRDGGVEIDDGQLRSVGAGTLKYAPTPLIPDNPALHALRNLHFEQLGMHLWYTADGAYRTQIKVDGNNPDFYDGYPVRLGLNINGKLPGLFRSALFSGDFSRHILEQLQSGKLD